MPQRAIAATAAAGQREKMECVRVREEIEIANLERRRRRREHVGDQYGRSRAGADGTAAEAEGGFIVAGRG